MAIYVTSDAHGHLRALDHVLEQAQPGADDTVYVLGDMVDRGPSPVGVMQLVRSIPGVRVLMGNHERMLLDTIATGDDVTTLTWEMNGGGTTAAGLDALPTEEYTELIDWVDSLPLFDVVTIDDLRPTAAEGARRTYLLAHAGFDALALRGFLATAGVGGADGYADVDPALLRDAMAAQDPEDLLWIRGEFWGVPTGLVGEDGLGPIAIAGHTPSVLLRNYADLMCGTGANEDGRGRIVEVGVNQSTGGMADRVNIDCSAAAGYPAGAVGIMRLEDRHMWFADIEDGE